MFGYLYLIYILYLYMIKQKKGNNEPKGENQNMEDSAKISINDGFKDEYERLKAILPEVWDDLLPQAQQRINESGVAFVDVEGELVTQLVGGANCVFTTYERGGMCLCAIEKAYREGRINWRKPMSCYLYPVRIKRFPGYDAVNFDRWKICKCAEVLGRREGIRLYQFLREPLIERYGQEWYDHLVASCELYIKEYLS